MSIILHLPVQISEQAWEDLIVGSGFDTFSWWGEVSYSAETGVLSGQVEDPAAEDEGVYLDFEVTLQEVADAASSLAKRNNRFAESMTQMDLDADDADCVVQECVLGDTIYG